MNEEREAVDGFAVYSRGCGSDAQQKNKPNYIFQIHGGKKRPAPVLFWLSYTTSVTG